MINKTLYLYADYACFGFNSGGIIHRGTLTIFCKLAACRWLKLFASGTVLTGSDRFLAEQFPLERLPV